INIYRMSHISVNFFTDNQSNEDVCIDKILEYSNEFENKISNFDKNTCEEQCDKCYSLNKYIKEIKNYLNECTDHFFYQIYRDIIKFYDQKCVNASKFSADTEAHDENFDKIEVKKNKCHEGCKIEIQATEEAKSHSTSESDSSKVIISEGEHFPRTSEEQLRHKVSGNKTIDSQDQQGLHVSGDSVENGDNPHELLDNNLLNRISPAEPSTRHLSSSDHGLNSKLDSKADASSEKSNLENETFTIITPRENGLETSHHQGKQQDEEDTNSNPYNMQSIDHEDVVRGNSDHLCPPEESSLSRKNRVEAVHADSGGLSDTGVGVNTENLGDEPTDVFSGDRTPIHVKSIDLTHGGEHSRSNDSCAKNICDDHTMNDVIDSKTKNGIHYINEIGDSKKN
ncbi:variable surface protein, partial [Plasmodium gonderi]